MKTLSGTAINLGKITSRLNAKSEHENGSEVNYFVISERQRPVLRNEYGLVPDSENLI